MSADPNELLRFILAQQQQQQQQEGRQQLPQQQGGDAQELTNQHLHTLYQQPEVTSSAFNATQPTSLLDRLSHLVANYLQGAAEGGTNTMAPVSNSGMHLLPQGWTAESMSSNQNMATQINTDRHSVSGNPSIHQQLLTAVKALTSINSGLATDAIEQMLAMDAQCNVRQQNQVQQLTFHSQEPFQTNETDRASSNILRTNDNGEEHAPIKAMKISDAPKRNNNFHKNHMKECDDGAPAVSMPTRLPAETHSNNRVATSSTSCFNGSDETSLKPSQTDSSGSVSLPTDRASLLTLQMWSLEQLETYVRKLQEDNRLIPNTVRIILEDARNKEEKKHAKRMANRKSASTSRARKKQLIDDLTAAHAKLRRQALILAYLPDPVVVIGISGEIRFCSAQTERMLRYKATDLIGSSIEDIIGPDSRIIMRQLIQVLVDAERHAISAQEEGWQRNRAIGASSDENGERNSGGSRDFSNEANTVSRSSDQSFPLLEVKFDDVDEGARENSSNSSDGQASKKNDKSNKTQATMSSFTNNSSSLTAGTTTSEDKEEHTAKKTKTTFATKNADSEESASSNERKLSTTKNHKTNCNKAEATVSSLTHNSSSLTAETSTSNDRKEHHSKKAKSNFESKKADSGESTSSDNHKPSDNRALNVDDVMGASVTANNADAKLSSLMHYSGSEKNDGDISMKLPSTGTQQQPSLERKHSVYYRKTPKASDKEEDSPSLSAESSTLVPSRRLNSSEDSGYRDSNETSESSSISGNSITLKEGKRQRPLAPACNVSLIRRDLTTIWCEVTASIRTRTHNDEDSELGIFDLNPHVSTDSEGENTNEEEKELLLCFRPILEGRNADKGMRLPEHKCKADNNSSDRNEETSSSGTETSCAKRGLTKKRTFASVEARLVAGKLSEKKAKLTQDTCHANTHGK